MRPTQQLPNYKATCAIHGRTGEPALAKKSIAYNFFTIHKNFM
jgi:hypothetical protein